MEAAEEADKLLGRPLVVPQFRLASSVDQKHGGELLTQTSRKDPLRRPNSLISHQLIYRRLSQLIPTISIIYTSSLLLLLSYTPNWREGGFPLLAHHVSPSYELQGAL